MKNFKILLASLLLLGSGLNVYSQTSNHNSTHSAHKNAHKELMANAKKGIDKSVLKQRLENEIVAKENAGSLSASTSKMIDDLLAEGRSHIGKRYVHGAKGPSAFDCSGFTSYVYRQFGYNISPASRQQYTEGVSVDRKNLRKGDLVFFTSPRSGKNVGHVGIVVSADNETGKFKFIHASIKGVKISDFDGYYVSRYIGAKRIIND
ncbi:MAG: C40 family peptidase [Muribaculaceae bacterium]|nr:C40 family peptidase [Muribaculaceae bacterium]